jgi:tetratricopeptide (TPR) repeat protein
MANPLSRHWAVWLLAATVAAAAAAGVVWRRSSPLSHFSETDADDADEPAAAAPGYVGMGACTDCHAERVAEFRTTSHYRACRRPTDGPMPPGFAAGRGTHRTHDPALRFEMTQSGGDYFQNAVRTTPAGEKRSSARIDFVYGAAKADEVFFSWRGERLYELTAVWLHPLNRWANASYNPHGTGEFLREATPRCLECHNTYMEHVPGTRNEYKRNNLVLGVTCEKCHGPGREHVAFHVANPNAETGKAVVHPGRLSRERLLDVCTQCHGNAVRHRGPAFAYRPGEPLENFYRTLITKHPEDDHVANQIQYLRQSKCFQRSDALTCVTCHDPHRPHAADDPNAARNACLNCHQPAACGEHNRLPAAVRANCVGCHMPQRVWINVHFHTSDDRYVPPIRRYQHRIAVYPEARDEVLLAWRRTRDDAASRKEAERLTRSLVAHWLAEAEKCRREHRYLAGIGFVREALRLDDSPAVRDRLRQAVAVQTKLDGDLTEALYQIEQRRFPQAIATLQGILSVKPDWAVAQGKLGTAYAAVGENQLAVKHLRAVAECDPDEPYGHVMLGWLAYLKGRPEEAIEHYRRADEAEPCNAKTHYHRGLAWLKLGRYADAERDFRRVLVIDPKHAGGCQGLGEALRKEGRLAEAVRYARRAARLTEYQDSEVLLNLAEVCVEAGRLAEAEDAAGKAIRAVRANNPEVVPQIRARWEEIRGRGMR